MILRCARTTVTLLRNGGRQLLRTGPGDVYTAAGERQARVCCRTQDLQGMMVTLPYGLKNSR